MIHRLTHFINKQKHTAIILLVMVSLLTLGACSQQRLPGSQLFGQKKPLIKTIKPLKPLNGKTIKIVKTRWQINTGHAPGINQLNPFITGSNLIVAGDHTISAYHKLSGKLAWQTNLGTTISAGISGNTDNIFIGTHSGKAVAIHTKTGKIKWIEDLKSPLLASSDSHNNYVVFRTADGQLHGLDASHGEIIWRQRQATPSLTFYGSSKPLMFQNHVIAGFDNGKIAAYQLETGTPAWITTISNGQDGAKLEQGTDIDGQLKIIGNALFAGGLGNALSGINLQTGEQAWNSRVSSLSGVDGNAQGLYSNDQTGNIWRLNPKDGTPIWRMDDLQGYLPGTPVLTNNNALVIADSKGNIHWVNAQSGQFIARTTIDKNGYLINPVTDHKLVYTYSKTGILSALFIE